MKTTGQRLQVTLVTHYGEKPPGVSALVRHLQRKLLDLFGPSFRPYEIAQVHGTVIGLEGCRLGKTVRNANSGMAIDLARLVEFLRSQQLQTIQVRVGGYQSGVDYPFQSRDTHPYLRSFSIQGDIAVAMGWPVQGSDVPNSLDQLRRKLQKFGVRHKWHRTDAEIDNDFFFVLGTLDRGAIDQAGLDSSTALIREELAVYGSTAIEISRDTLRLVGYSDTQLPRDTSCWYDLDEPDLVAKLAEMYPDCEGTG